MTASTKEISILGCGWFGLDMAKKLVADGYHVKGSTTSPEKMPLLSDAGITPFLIDFEEASESFDPDFFSSRILLVTIPPKRREAEQHTFLSKIKKIAAAAVGGKVSHLILISSISVYGDHHAEVDENSVPSPDTPSGKAILEAEDWVKNIPGITATIIRFAGLIGPARDPGKWFAGKTAIPNGKAPVNLIHLSDCIGITARILEREAFGDTYNACNTDHPSRAIFYTGAAKRSGLLPPQFNDELLNWKRVSSIRVYEQLGYVFEAKLYSDVSQ